MGCTAMPIPFFPPFLFFYFYFIRNLSPTQTQPQIPHLEGVPPMGAPKFYATCDVPLLLHLQYISYALLQVDNVVSTQRKTFGLALSLILTLRLPQVLDKLDQILRYSDTESRSIFFTLFAQILFLKWWCSNNNSACTSVILGGSEDLTEEESRYIII